MYIKRERYLSKIRPFYDVDLIKVLTGVRRCGKSILLEQIKEEFIEKSNYIYLTSIVVKDEYRKNIMVLHYKKPF